MRMFATLLLLVALGSAPAGHRYVVTWAMESDAVPADKTGHDFLAVFDAADGPSFGNLVAMLPVQTRSQMVHHTTVQQPPNGMIFANDFMADESYVFDLTNVTKPKVAARFTDAGPYTHPHSFTTLSNGNVLATYQINAASGESPGALVELDPKGKVLRTSDAASSVDPNIRPYGLIAIESLDRVVTTSAPMPPLKTKAPTHVVQLWRLSDLHLLKTIVLPSSRSGNVDEYADDGAVLADGKTVLVKTSTCGLYMLHDLAGNDARASLVYDYGYRSCSGVPVVAGHYWIEASMSGHGITSLDVSDPEHPVEVGHIILGPQARPHWLSSEAGTGDLVVTGYGSMLHAIYFAHVDLRTGALSLDSRRIDMNRRWPDGWNGNAIPHGTMFYR